MHFHASPFPFHFHSYFQCTPRSDPNLSVYLCEKLGYVNQSINRLAAAENGPLKHLDLKTGIPGTNDVRQVLNRIRRKTGRVWRHASSPFSCRRLRPDPIPPRPQ